MRSFSESAALPRALERARSVKDQLGHRALALLSPDAQSGTEQWQRVTLNRAVGDYLESLRPADCDAAEISGDAQRHRGWKSFTSLDFPEFDLCAPLTVGRTFDVVICEQVIEHVVDPVAAARNLRGLSAPGGHVIVSTPFLIRIHELPMFAMFDYWRFTPRGLQRLLEDAGLVVDSVSSWGNRRCVTGNFDRWPARRWWHSRRNEPNIPVQVWAFARNPESGTSDLG
jgi:SAM-dependent methyltransferase